MGAGTRAASVGQELFLYAVSAALSCLVLFVGLRHLDPNRAQLKKAQEQKKEIAKRLGRPLIQTNTYEVRILAPSLGFQFYAFLFEILAPDAWRGCVAVSRENCMPKLNPRNGIPDSCVGNFR